MPDEQQSFTDVKARLDEIAEEVAREDISLDDALALYEEAVKLGLAACDVSEADLAADAEAKPDAELDAGSRFTAADVAEGGAQPDDAAPEGDAQPADAALVAGADLD